MAVLEIRQLGDGVLRGKAAPVRRISRSVKALLDDMAETMYAAKGAGLAAPQVGVAKRIVVIDAGDGLIELINPRLTRLEGEEGAVEGCLSIPEYIGYVRRANRAEAEALNRNGEKIWIAGEGLLARALQHEIDHLDGILFVDRAEKLYKNEPAADAVEEQAAPDAEAADGTAASEAE
ncbi:MAG: peptide deformylase [bacterium]|jgi:peptide deformylase